jgi:hypothetical protein
MDASGWTGSDHIPSLFPWSIWQAPRNDCPDGFLGATILMTLSVVEITFCISALYAADPGDDAAYQSCADFCGTAPVFIVAAPSLFLPLGIVLVELGQVLV